MVRLSSVSSHWMDEAPMVSISGSFLNDFGFSVASKVVVEVSKGVITIKALDSEEEL